VVPQIKDKVLIVRGMRFKRNFTVLLHVDKVFLFFFVNGLSRANVDSSTSVLLYQFL